MDAKQISKIEEETKKLLDKFSKALSGVKSNRERNVERDSDRRREGEGKICENNFRKIMFENAPQHDENFIKGEKKTW